MIEHKYLPAIEFTYNFTGLLKPHMKEAIYHYINFPSNDNWTEIYSMMIAKGRVETMWQAVLAIDPTFPKVISKDAYISEVDINWERIPTPEQILEALRFTFALRINHPRNLS